MAKIYEESKVFVSNVAPHEINNFFQLLDIVETSANLTELYGLHVKSFKNKYHQ